MSELLVNTTNGVRTLTLNRPEKRNALNEALILGLNDELRNADREDGLCAVVVNGSGSDFCAGADLSALQRIAENSVMDNLADAEGLAELFSLIRRMRLPVIAAVHGRALAGGCGLATACDLVLAARSARFGYPEVKIGFVPAIVTAILRRNISEKRAFELITRGGEFSAEEAAEMGLVNRVFNDDSFIGDVQSYAEGFSKLSRSAIALSKKLLYQMDGLSFEAALQAGAEVNTIARMTDDCRNGIAKFLSRE